MRDCGGHDEGRGGEGEKGESDGVWTRIGWAVKGGDMGMGPTLGQDGCKGGGEGSGEGQGKED